MAKGETAESIADEMAKVLNDACAEREAQVKAEAEKSNAARVEDAQHIADHMNEFAKKYYGEDLDYNAESVVGSIEVALKLAEGLNDIFEKFSGLKNIGHDRTGKNCIKEKSGPMTNSRAEKIIDDFIKGFGL